MIKVAHVITGLSIGGAETMLLKLLTHSDRGVFAHRVYTLLSPAGPLAGAVRDLGVPVREIGMGRGIPNPAKVFQLARWLREDPPDLVQTWMYHADLVGGLAAGLSRLPLPVLWNIRNGTLDAERSRRRTRWIVKVCARLSSRLPDAIISCSHAALRIHTAAGYDATRFHVIPNGFDLGAFQPNPKARVALRQELGIPEQAPVIGLIGRFDPQKDHQTFIEAAGRLHASMANVHFVLCGRDVTRTNPELMRWIDAARVTAVCHLLGQRTDMPAVTAMLDVASSSSSYGEAFPNTVGEAMACGIPCVVTDVGDSAQIVGDTGRVVPPRNPQALSDAWADLMGRGAQYRQELGVRARERVSQNFSIGRVARSYEETYRRVLALRTDQMVGIPNVAGSVKKGSVAR
jgi:glycosyltransferase involved in cell wall biosynthesis